MIPAPADVTYSSDAELAADAPDRLRFEAMLADVFLQFVHPPTEAVDEVIEAAQRQVCQCLGLDRSTLWQIVDAGAGKVVLTHLWQSADGPLVVRHPDPRLLSNADWVLTGGAAPPIPLGIEAEAFFPQLLATVQNQGYLVIPDVDALPESLARERQTIVRFGAKAVLVIPLHAEQIFMGAVTFEMLREPRRWPATLVQRLVLVAQAFAGVLARRRAEAALRQSQARLDLAARGAGAGLWTAHLPSDTWWVTAQARALFGFAPDTPVTMQRILEAIDPEDRAGVRAVIEQTAQAGEDGSAEYRVHLPDGRLRWLLSRGHLHRERPEGPAIFMGMTVDITPRKLAEQTLKAALEEVRALRDTLEQENTQLRARIGRQDGHDAIVGESPRVVEMLAAARRVGATDAVVLLAGETGTGKELLAEVIHQWSSRAKREMVKVNCAALPPSLIESELFGRERGAYTGAMSQQAGRFEAADGSTLFLDEIAELPLESQGKLLRVLQEGQFERLGSSRTRQVDVRIIAATARDLEKMVQEGRFRADLYYRLNVFPITVPPLRERVEDISLLAWAFVRHYATKMGKSIDAIPRRSLAALQAYPWPGNIRELRNLIERAVILSDSRVLRVVLPAPASGAAAPVTLAEVERQHILAVLAQTQWRVSGPTGAAAVLGLVPTTLHSKMKKLGIARPPSGRTKGARRK